jgi:protein-disulfide isomerase
VIQSKTKETIADQKRSSAIIKKSTVEQTPEKIICPPCPKYSASSQQIEISDLKKIAWHRLPPAKHQTALNLLNQIHTPCGCGQTLAQCAKVDIEKCKALRDVIDFVISSVHNGISENKTIQAGMREILHTHAQQTVPITPPPLRRPSAGKVYYVPADQTPSIGTTDASLTVVLFSDFECPYCRQILGHIRQVEAKYSSKEVRLVFRHFPMPQYARAPRAAEASLAAHAQGKFWLYHDMLYANPMRLEFADLVDYAKQLKLDSERFQKELLNGTYREQVNRDLQLALRLRIPGTPFVFINGLPVIDTSQMLNVAETAWTRSQTLLKEGIKREQLYNKLIEYGLREP